MNTKFIKKFGIAMVAILIAVGFSAYKVGESNSNKADDPEVTVYFHGDPTDQNEVEDPTFWTDQPNGQACNKKDFIACSMKVVESDLILVGTIYYLNTAAISINAVYSGLGYYPTTVTGSNRPNVEIINRN